MKSLKPLFRIVMMEAMVTGHMLIARINDGYWIMICAQIRNNVIICSHLRTKRWLKIRGNVDYVPTDFACLIIVIIGLMIHHYDAIRI